MEPQKPAPKGAGPGTPAPAPSPEVAEALKTLSLVNDSMKQKAEGVKTEALMLDELKKQTELLANMYKIVYLAGQKFGLVPK